MPPTFEVTEHGAAQVAKLIEDIGTHAIRAAPAMVKIGIVLQAAEIALWKRHGGKSWPKRADGSQPGVQSGALERSLTEAGEGAIREIHEDHIIFGTSLWYAHFMLGTKHQPKRKILAYTTTVRKKTAEIIADHLLGDLK